jgi:hypothetical protein
MKGYIEIRLLGKSGYAALLNSLHGKNSILGTLRNPNPLGKFFDLNLFKPNVAICTKYNRNPLETAVYSTPQYNSDTLAASYNGSAKSTV